MKLLGTAILIHLFISCGHLQGDIPVTVQGPLEKLKAGNAKFVSGQPVHPHETPGRIRELKEAQHPFVILVSCSDSRIPPELIFDQGLGDIFSIRTAGNIIGEYELGSIEYAVEHLHCKLIVVLGHENCGAIQAYASAQNEKPGSSHIQNLLNYIACEEEEKNIPVSERSDIDRLVKANILHGVKLLRSSSPVLKPLYDRNEIRIISAYYDLDNGKVFFDN